MGPGSNTSGAMREAGEGKGSALKRLSNMLEERR
jgi:hypothetical protein